MAYKVVHTTQQARDMDPIVDHCWASVADDGLVLNQQWINVPRLLERG